MRVFKFLKVDFIKMKSLWIALLFPILSVVLLVTDDTPRVLFGAAYCLFAGIIYATFPFTGENPQENGFLMMLPSKPGDDIKGHYLFGFLSVTSALILGLLSVLIAGLFNRSVRESVIPAGALLALYGLALVFVGIEELLLTICRYESMRALQLIRIIPAFVYFFGISAVTDNLPVQSASALSQGELIPVSAGLLFLAGSIAVYVVIAFISVRLVVRRGY
ncbi:MAG: hypothetical protein E7240_07415 [Lachnospiraceae bacterium]|nr:hypothetical protein [Lachnospiraceae bacterium]